MAVSASELRQNVYRLLDEVLDTGMPLEIERAGRRLRIVVADDVSKLSRLTPHPDLFDGDPEELVHVDWSSEWRP
ncbi:type II toxin-antitoxin system Phd/YefM family antitoxin [Microlunatus sp. GCM10028923]|uniref:type II toxin-antitoxin system Phd/YefM family antitoxin n=1 Tax=Microlunatus sp. GCM10028923 TaxID=3273400 RepID=UPI0036208544